MQDEQQKREEEKEEGVQMSVSSLVLESSFFHGDMHFSAKDSSKLFML